MLVVSGTETVALDVLNTPGVHADPSAWAVVQGIRQAEADTAAVSADTGLLVCSENPCRATTAAVRRQVLAGRVRPRHFAAAGPGTLAGLPCVVLGFRGPTLVLTAPLDRVRAHAQFIAGLWLAQEQCARVLIVEHREVPPLQHHVRVRTLDSPAPSPRPAGIELPAGGGAVRRP
jgi:hypothetical protein